ncbi:hypothetical protein K2X33_16360 [bacterium]|nr:hypothetical protein [bacterium]
MMSVGSGEFAVKRFISTLVVALVVSATASATPVFVHPEGGFELGNGITLNPSDFSDQGLEVTQDFSQEFEMRFEVLAPADDCNPRSTLSVAVYPMPTTTEEDLKSMLPSKEGWIGSMVGKLARFHRELSLSRDRQRLELETFQGDQNIVVTLTGNKRKSAFYNSYAKDLTAAAK